MRRLLIAALFLFPVAALAGDFAVGPRPSWVEPAKVDLATASQKDARWGVDSLLDDHQVRVSAGSTISYTRHVRRIVSAAGVQNASEVEFDFDPSYQRLTIHEIAIVRGGRRINALDPASIRVIEKEDESGDHLYDGMLTAVAFLNDVRPGDILDDSSSLTGANPLLGGRYADTYDLTAPVPTRLIRHRLLIPSGRPLHVRSTLQTVPASIPRSNPDVVTAAIVAGGADETIYTWERRNVPPIDTDDRTPDWFDPYDHVQVSEFASWHDVALWADALFQLDDASRAAVRDLAATIRREHPLPSDQSLAAIRFVQDDIRYLGIEMGRSSHEPHQPAAVLEQRWGDCKDKAFLLAALLRELGGEAWPAMVNTRLRHSMDGVLPSPFEFDHVITAVAVRGRTLWIDPTLADQGGTLETIETPDDERALVVRSETTALTPIQTNKKGATRIELAYVTRQWDGPTTLTVRSTVTGGDADVLRADLASMSASDLEKERINRLASDHPRIAAVAPIAIEDDRGANRIVTVEKYEIRDLWKGGQWSYSPHELEDHLTVPETVLRSTPLAFDFPLDVTEIATFELPGPVSLDPDDSVEENATFRYESHVVRSGNSVVVTHTLRAKKDSVAAAGIADHLTKVNQILDGSGVTMSRPQPAFASAMAGTSVGGIALGAAGIVGLALGVLLSRRRRPADNPH